MKIFKSSHIFCILMIIIIASLDSVYSQRTDYTIHTIAFYNLENLFDPIDNPETLDEYSPIMELPTNERKKVYEKKINNMAKVISQIGVNKRYNPYPPSIIGVCEIENKKVLQDLIASNILKKYNYTFIHYDSPDKRGIDVALLYQQKKFKPLDYNTHTLKLFDTNEPKKRIFTRDQLLVKGKLANEEIYIIVNHWPSRRGGEAKSEPLRIKAAQLTKKIIDSLQVKEPYSKIILMGDFNDDPFNESFTEVLKTKQYKKEVPFKGLYNPMMQMSKKGMGTLAFRDALNIFDQLVFSKPLVDNDFTRLTLFKTGIYNPNYLIKQSGRYKGYPFRSFENGKWSGGYSDHFPVYCYLIRKLTK